MIGTLAVDGWTVTFGTASGLQPLLAVPTVTAHLLTASVTTSYSKGLNRGGAVSPFHTGRYRTVWLDSHQLATTDLWCCSHVLNIAVVDGWLTWDTTSASYCCVRATRSTYLVVVAFVTPSMSHHQIQLRKSAEHFLWNRILYRRRNESWMDGMYRVRQKSSPITSFTVFSATALNLNAKFYTHVYSSHAHITALTAFNYLIVF